MPDQRIETDKELEEVLSSHRTQIAIIGAGGGGNNTVTRLLEVGVKGVEVIAINTDAQDLLYAKADRKILIGKNITNGLGAGSDPDRGEQSARENIKEIEEALSRSDMVFVTCGLGGGTGTGSAPIIAELAKKTGALTIAIVTLPFSDEGVIRWENARKGLEQLQNKVDTVIVVQNDRLLDLVPDMPLNQAFKVADEILVNAVKGITELVTEKGLVNLDFADVRTVMENGGVAMIGLGESETHSDAEEAATKALENPLLDVDITGAKSALINITGGQDMSLKSAKTIMQIIAKRLDPSARIIWGARLDEDMGQSLRVMLIVTCLKASRRSASDIEMVLRQSEPAEEEAMEKEEEVVSVEPEPEPEPSEKPKESKKGNKVFSEIFVEESQVDISVLEEAVTNLKVGERSGNEKYLRKIKNASKSLYNSSELFGFDTISDFAEIISRLTESALNAEFDLSESLIELYGIVPSTLEGMIAGSDEAYQKASEIKQKFSHILDLLDESDTNNAEPGEFGEIAEPDSAELDRIAEGDQESKSNSNSGKKNRHDNNNPNFSNVKEAVKFIDKLF